MWILKSWPKQTILQHLQFLYHQILQRQKRRTFNNLIIRTDRVRLCWFCVIHFKNKGIAQNSEAIPGISTFNLFNSWRFNLTLNNQPGLHIFVITYLFNYKYACYYQNTVQKLCTYSAGAQHLLNISAYSLIFPNQMRQAFHTFYKINNNLLTAKLLQRFFVILAFFTDDDNFSKIGHFLDWIAKHGIK